jgi:hypothetical protein
MFFAPSSALLGETSLSDSRHFQSDLEYNEREILGTKGAGSQEFKKETRLAENPENRSSFCCGAALRLRHHSGGMIKDDSKKTLAPRRKAIRRLKRRTATTDVCCKGKSRLSSGSKFCSGTEFSVQYTDKRSV